MQWLRICSGAGIIRSIIAYFRDIRATAAEIQATKYALAEMKAREIRTAEHLATYEDGTI